MKRLIVVILLAVIINTVILAGASGDANQPSSMDDKRLELRREVFNIYKDVVDLYMKGVNVSSYVDRLDQILWIINNGGNRETLDNIEEELNSIRHDLENLKSIADKQVLKDRLERYAAAVLILITPLIFYIAFPRIYLYIWYKLHERWVVEE